MFIHLKYTTINDHIDDRNISREISSQIQLAVGQANLGGRLENFLFSHQNRLRQWALRWNWAFYIPFQSCKSIHPRKLKYCGVFSSLKSRAPLGLRQWTIWKVYSLRPKLSLMMGLILIIMHLKWLSINARNSTFSGLFAPIEWNSMSVNWVAWHSACCSISPERSLRMERLCSNLQ